jgi:glycosyltransferase involved in cell wall biosynthesis
MPTTENPSETTGERPRIALITNHGYAGVEIPVGGAPDTGGQNFYVNSLARALDQLGFEVTIFARGGFPFFKSDRIREGTEQLTDHVRYVYVPGGGDTFLRKEDIAPALDEQVRWLDEHIAAEAEAAGVAPWELYECLNTHYWDAAIIGVKLVERWQDLAARDFIATAQGGALAAGLDRFAGEEAHRQGLSREIDLHLGQLATDALAIADPGEILARLLGEEWRGAIPTEDIGETAPAADRAMQQLERIQALGQELADGLEVDGQNVFDVLTDVDRHVWTPHSVGIIKERNFWNKDLEVVRALKFRERNAHEEVICARTKMFCSTSPDIWSALASYHRVPPEEIFDFPPCIDGQAFRPRDAAELEPGYAYLAAQSGVPIETLRRAKIVFETSRMDRTKRKDLLLSAFARVAPALDDAFLFIGGGPAGSELFVELEQLKAELPALEGRAFLLGFVPDDVIEILFSLADLFVSGSEMEGFGMSVSQAAAARVCVVASDLIPFATDWAADAAVVLPAGDVEAFAQAIERLLRDDEERATRAARLQEIASKLDWPATTSRFIQWFRDFRNS